MADNFGLKIGLEGEKEFKKALSDINQSFKVLGSEMKLVASQFDKNDNSVQALTARNNVLNKEIETQKEKIETLRSALANASESFGDTDRRTQSWQIQLNNAKAALNEMERELDSNNAALDEAASGFDDSGEAASGMAKDMDSAADKAGELDDSVDDAGDAADDAKNKFSGFGDVLKKVGTAVGAVCIAAGAAAIKLGKDVINSFGELEQNLGGAESVFQDLGKNISEMNTQVITGFDKSTGAAITEMQSLEQVSANAYKNMGVSQSDYLANLNKMGALFQGSGLDQQRALDLSTQAMQRAADMASVMGISTEDALNAVTAAAKGNYTMMDNIGVSMNATTLEAYALSKGIDTAWASMSNADKAELAMSYFFEKTEQYSGNFARESTETIQGSIGLMQAAVRSFVAGLGNADADMKLLTLNMVEAFKTVLKNVVPIVQNIVAALPTAMEGLLEALGEILPTLLSTVTDLFDKVLETLLTLLPQIIPAVVDALLSIVETIVENLPLIVDAAVQIVTSLVEGIASALPELIPTAVQAIITIVQGLISNLPLILDAALQLIKGLAEGILAALPELIKALPSIILAIVDFILGAIPQIIDAGIQLLTALVGALPEIIAAIVEAIPQIIDGIITAVIDAIPLIIQAGIDLLVALIQALPEIIATIVKAIPEIISGIVDALIGNIDKIIMAGVELFVALIENLPTIIAEIVKAIPKIITGIVEAIGNLTYKMVEAGANLLKGLWEGIKSMISWLWNKVKDWATGLVGKIKNTLGIHSPSTVFANIGENMGLGLGEGFVDAMADVEKDMQKAIPTDFDIDPINAMANIDTDTAFPTVGDTLASGLNAVLALLREYLPQYGNMQLVADTGAVIGWLAPGMDNALGVIQKRKERFI